MKHLVGLHKRIAVLQQGGTGLRMTSLLALLQKLSAGQQFHSTTVLKVLNLFSLHTGEKKKEENKKLFKCFVKLKDTGILMTLLCYPCTRNETLLLLEYPA